MYYHLPTSRKLINAVRCRLYRKRKLLLGEVDADCHQYNSEHCQIQISMKNYLCICDLSIERQLQTLHYSAIDTAASLSIKKVLVASRPQWVNT